MDGEDIIGLCLLAFLFASPFILVLSITGCIAYSRMRQWQKENKALVSGNVDTESSRLVDETQDEEDFLDSEDEADFKAKQDEERSDRALTPRQKFRKEFKRCWSGAGAKEMQKQREREEREKIAKAVAKEIARLERRNVRKANKAGTTNDEFLPSYNNAVADRKH